MNGFDLLRGILIVIFITLVAGVIAYIGDRVGHQVGRRRLTLFGLRPKYTSTIVAVGTGMLIALSVTIIAIIGSQYTRQALFQIGSLSGQVEHLQQQADALKNEVSQTRNNAYVISRFQPIFPEFLVLHRDENENSQLDALSKYFDQTVSFANKNLVPLGLRPVEGNAKTPDIAEKLRQQVAKARQEMSEGSADVLLQAVADQNLFRGDTIHFAFDQTLDRQLAAKGEVLATVATRGGSNIQLPIYQLVSAADAEIIRRGMPSYYVFPAGAAYSPVQLRALQAQVAKMHGPVTIVATAGRDTYPHTAALVLNFKVVQKG